MDEHGYVTIQEVRQELPLDLPKLRSLLLCWVQEPFRPTGGRHRRQECPYQVGLYPQMRRLNHRCGISGCLHSQKLLLHLSPSLRAIGLIGFAIRL